MADFTVVQWENAQAIYRNGVLSMAGGYELSIDIYGALEHLRKLGDRVDSVNRIFSVSLLPPPYDLADIPGHATMSKVPFPRTECPPKTEEI